MALILQEDRKNGLHELNEAAGLNPNLAGPHLSLGHFYFEAGDYAKARSELRTAIKLEPTLEDSYYFLALVEKQDNNVALAASLLQKAVALNPGNANAQFLLGQNLEKLGKTGEAIQHWKQAVLADPNQSQALYNLARALNKLHDPDARQYQDCFDALQQRDQVADRVELLRRFALESGKAQNWPQAIAQLKEAVQVCGQCSGAAHLHKNLAYFYQQTGKLSEAQDELEAAVTLDPSDGVAKDALAALRALRAEQR
jgi:tetratricopeptide (TPR) repeat protein